MLPKQVLLVAILVSSVGAYSVAGMYDSLPLESTTLESSDGGSGNDSGDDNGFASGADAIAIDTDCSTKEDGLYAIGGCSPQFLTCSGGIARIMDCPANLIYDHRIVACEYSYNVPECSGVPQDVTSTRSYYPTEDTTVAAEATVNPYASVEVVPTTTTEGSAEETTSRYDTTVSPYAPIVLETSTDPAEDAAATAETTAYSYGSVDDSTTAPAEDSPVTRAAQERSCAGRVDGFYSFGDCSDHYIACSNGYTILMQCPANLAFDEARVICDYMVNVPECQNSSGYDQGAVEENTTEASGELPYNNGHGYDETTTVAYEPEVAETTTGSYPEETTTVADIPSTVVDYTPEVVETTTAPYEQTTSGPYEETTTAGDAPVDLATVQAAYVATTDETTTAPNEPAEVTSTTTTGPAEDVTETAVGPYATVVMEATTAPVEEATVPVESTTAADVPNTVDDYTPEVVETTTAPSEETTTASYEETTTSADAVVNVPVETTTEQAYETTAEDTTATPYVPVEVETTTEPLAETTTTTVAEYTPEVTDTTVAQYEETTTIEIPSCVEGATAIEPCSQHYKNCVNGHEAIFNCESGLVFSPEHGRCTTADQIAECHQAIMY